MTPMGTNYGETSGEMSNRHMNYYSLRAKGGTGLIILENANIEYPVGSNGTSQIRIDHDSFMPRYYQLVENLHKNGAMVAIQVNHAGASASSARTGMETVSSSNIPTKAGGEIPRPMTRGRDPDDRKKITARRRNVYRRSDLMRLRSTVVILI